MKTTSTDQSSSITLDTSYIIGPPMRSVSIDTSTITMQNHKLIDFKELADIPHRLEKIERLLGILTDPTAEQLEQHCALKDAYNKYKLIEKLLLGDNSET